jgi:hypothetical protein
MILLEKQTAAANSNPTDIAGGTRGANVTSTFRVIGGVLGSGEFVQLQYFDGTAYRVANSAGDAGKILDENNAVRTVYGRMTDIRVAKSVTAAEIGVEVV